jgi:hypothetical protein
VLAAKLILTGTFGITRDALEEQVMNATSSFIVLTCTPGTSEYCFRLTIFRA